MKPCTLLLFLCVLAAWIPLRSRSIPRDDFSGPFPGWKTVPLPIGLSPAAADACTVRFAADFPGEIGVFTDGARTYVVRWVRTPTRKLHPAADCLRALGYKVQPMPIFAASDGSHWGSSSAQHGVEQLRVRERIVDSAGREWTDASAWFWAAAFGRSSGPWWAITIIEPNAELSALL
jgi:hypothetical protein